MEEQPIPFAQGQASGLDELSGMQPMLINLLPDAAGALHARPGIQAWSDFGSAPVASPVIGMFAWRQWLLFVTKDRNIWAWQSSGSVIALSSSSDATTQLDGSNLPIWTYDSTRVVVSGGGAPQQWQGSGSSSRLAPGAISPSGSLLTLTHIAYSAQRFIGNLNDNSGYLQWTDPGPGNHTSWPPSGVHFAEAEASPDPVVALYANTNEVYAFGTETLQVYLPDPTLAFVTGASVQIGCSAPYSVINTDADFAWLDDDRRFTESGGRQFKVLSSPGMAGDVSKLGTISDCWGTRIKFQSWDLLVWCFPTEKRAIYYDRITQKWGEFRSLNAAGEWIAWLPQSYFFWSDKNLHLVGMSDGTIAQLSASASTDLGSTIRGQSRTGFQDRGTFSRKQCQRVALQVRRDASVTTTGTDPRVEYRYRDDLGQWSPVRTAQLGGTYQPVQPFWSLGMYRQREHEITLSNAAGFVLAGATESFEAVES